MCEASKLAAPRFPHYPSRKNLAFIMAEIHLINDPNYWKSPLKPRGYKEWVDMYEGNGQIVGLWELVQWNPRTGEVVQRVFNKNVVTDQGAVNILQRAINSSGATLPALFNNLAITNNSGSSTLTTALTNGQTGVTSLAVAALPAAIPSGTTIQLGYGTGQTQNVVTSASAAQGATSITVTSFTSNAAYAIGTNVVPLPGVADNPANSAAITANATTGLIQFSGNLATGAFTFNATTGAGNRNVVVSYTFANSVNGGTTPNGVYTDNWIVNVNASGSLAAGVYVAHEINTQMQCNNNNNITATATIKI